MRIAISGVVGTCLALCSGVAEAQPHPGQPGPAAQPAPRPLVPPAPPPAPAAPAALPPAAPVPGVVAQPDSAPVGAPPPSSALAVPEAPPAPGAAGTTPTAQPKAPPPPAQSFGDETGMAWKPNANQEPNAGWHGMFFLRDNDDQFHLFPRMLMQLDLNSFFGSGVNGKSTANGGAGLPTRFFARRFRFGFGGDFLKRWSFLAQIDITSGTDNNDGTAQLFAGPPGQTPTGATARYRPVQSASAGLSPADLWLNYSLCPCLNFQFGQFDPPVGMERQTSPWQLPFMERNMVVRSFVAPAGMETGLMIWGDIGERVFTYELMVAGGDGENRPQVDSAADFLGRLTVKPLNGIKLVKDAHIGVSARHGERDPSAVGYTYPAISSNQGYLLFNPNYTDSQNRHVRVIPSGAQNLIGGELRLPIGPVDIRGEGYYVANHTREAIDGYQLTNTERLGTMKGGAFYAQATWWAIGDSFISGDPGLSTHPAKLNLRKKDPIKRGVELTGLVAGIFGTYDGNSRGGHDDEKTPGSAGNPATHFKVWQFGGAASYWHSRWVRLSVNYAAYLTPSSGTPENLAVVPGDVTKGGNPTAHTLHELGTRLQLWF